jgi:hypothetical protein
MKTTGEIIAIFDKEIYNDKTEMLPYKEPELNSILVFGGAETAAFVHGYRVAEKDHCANVQELCAPSGDLEWICNTYVPQSDQDPIKDAFCAGFRMAEEYHNTGKHNEGR